MSVLPSSSPHLSPPFPPPFPRSPSELPKHRQYSLRRGSAPIVTAQKHDSNRYSEKLSDILDSRRNSCKHSDAHDSHRFSISKSTENSKKIELSGKSELVDNADSKETDSIKVAQIEILIAKTSEQTEIDRADMSGKGGVSDEGGAEDKARVSGTDDPKDSTRESARESARDSGKDSLCSAKEGSREDESCPHTEGFYDPKRIPSYTDRVLYTSIPGDGCLVLHCHCRYCHC